MLIFNHYIYLGRIITRAHIYWELQHWTYWIYYIHQPSSHPLMSILQEFPFYRRENWGLGNKMIFPRTWTQITFLTYIHAELHHFMCDFFQHVRMKNNTILYASRCFLHIPASVGSPEPCKVQPSYFQQCPESFVCVNDQIQLASMGCSTYPEPGNWGDWQDSNKVSSWKIYYKGRIHSSRSKRAQSNLTEAWNTWAQLPGSALRCIENAPSWDHEPATWEGDICLREDEAQVSMEVLHTSLITQPASGWVTR